MKKVKIMMLSLLVIGAVATGLAFKAKTFAPGLKCGVSLTSCPTQIIDQNWKITTDELNHFPNTYCTVSDGTTTDCTYATVE